MYAAPHLGFQRPAVRPLSSSLPDLDPHLPRRESIAQKRLGDGGIHRRRWQAIGTAAEVLDDRRRLEDGRGNKEGVIAVG